MSIAGELSSVDVTWLPTRAELGSLLCPSTPRHRTVSELHSALAAFGAAADAAARARALERIGRWVCAGAEPPATLRAGRRTSNSAFRLELLLLALELRPALRDRIGTALTALLSEADALKLLAEAGLPNDRGLMAEMTDRIARRLLPEPPAHGDLTPIVGHVVRKRAHADALAELDEDLLDQLGKMFPEAWSKVAPSVEDSIALLVSRVTALGLTDDLRDRSPPGSPRQSPFYRISHVPAGEIPALIPDCRKYIAHVYERLEERGVSVDVVYCLELIGRSLSRIEILLPLAAGSDPAGRPTALRALLRAIGEAQLETRSLLAIMRTNLRLLARKVIERVGETGEHYVTSSRREYWKMLGSAAGGGFLTAGTCAIKFLTKWGHYPLFVDGLLSAANYAASFVVMQLLGFTLATKQPSMTAAALAGAIRDKRGPERLGDLASLITRISRSQFAAALGNVGMVIPAAFGFDWIWLQTTGKHFLDAKTAEKTLASFHVLDSGTIPYAALTGILLWVSSIGAGWFENWVTYRRLPEAIEHHRASRIFGKRLTAWAGRFLAHNAAGFGGNVGLGILLGMVPVIGLFTGLPLDVRHITLSTGALTLSVCTLGFEVLARPEFKFIALGIAAIGLLNFGVSFVCALAVAFRAREVSTRERFFLLRAVIFRFFRAPFSFFFPPRDPAR